MRDEELKALAEKAPKDFGPTDATWRYIEAASPDLILRLLARIAALRAALDDAEAKASLGAKITDHEHPKIADGFIIIATHLHNALAADDEAQS